MAPPDNGWKAVAQAEDGKMYYTKAGHVVAARSQAEAAQMAAVHLARMAPQNKSESRPVAPHETRWDNDGMAGGRSGQHFKPSDNDDEGRFGRR